jgi:hypothetical protein
MSWSYDRRAWTGWASMSTGVANEVSVADACGADVFGCGDVTTARLFGAQTAAPGMFDRFPIGDLDRVHSNSRPERDQ